MNPRIPALPPGVVAQPVSHRDVDGMCYELHWVYGPDGRLDRDASFWLVMPLDERDPRPARWITWRDHRNAAGRNAVAFGRFAAWTAPTALIDEWLKGARPPGDGLNFLTFATG